MKYVSTVLSANDRKPKESLQLVHAKEDISNNIQREAVPETCHTAVHKFFGHKMIIRDDISNYFDKICYYK
jgi:uncharacterized protein YlzI (FlbEa/FlbD family)